MSRVLAVALIPALVLAALWNWAGERASSRPVVTVPTVEQGADGPDSAATAVALSWRRVADAVVADETADELRDGLDRLTAGVDDRTCLVVDTGSSVVVASDAELNLGPVQSVVVAAAGLILLGPDHRPMTAVFGSPPVDGIVDGDLILLGGGDPLLGTREVSGPPRRHPLPTTPLEALVDALRLTGVERVTGDVVGVSDRYEDVARPDAWQVPLAEASRVGALLVDRGRIRGGPGNVALDPAQGAARSLLEVLREGSIAVDGSARTDSASALEGREMLAEVAGETLADVVGGWLTGPDARVTADGWAEFADALLMEIGYAVAGSGTRLGGAAAVSALLEEISRSEGVAASGWEPTADLRDGPGLDAGSTSSCGTLAWALATIESLVEESGRPIGLDVIEGDRRRAVVAELPGETRSRIVVVGDPGTVADLVDSAQGLDGLITGASTVTAEQLAPLMTGGG
jgi:D-alanyl-D-alanine carboxypeptidase/D-alanyl-D-alanine-endopeptidase (penicillin-binding protein 4)